MDQIKVYMEENLVTVKPEASATEAAKLMLGKKVGALLVKDASKCLGIITEADLTYKVLAKDLNPVNTKVSAVMSSALITLDCEKTMMEAYQLMRRNNIRHLAITENKKLVGMLSIKDFANYYNNKFGSEEKKQETE